MSIRENLFMLAQTLNYDSLPKREANDGLIKAGLTIVFTIVGAISIMMIVIGGIQYSSSQGDPQAISKAKNTIIYAVVGVIISIFSISIVGFVLGKVA